MCDYEHALMLFLLTFGSYPGVTLTGTLVPALGVFAPVLMITIALSPLRSNPGFRHHLGAPGRQRQHRRGAVAGRRPRRGQGQGAHGHARLADASRLHAGASQRGCRRFRVAYWGHGGGRSRRHGGGWVVRRRLAPGLERRAAHEALPLYPAAARLLCSPAPHLLRISKKARAACCPVAIHPANHRVACCPVALHPPDPRQGRVSPRLQGPAERVSNGGGDTISLLTVVMVVVYNSPPQYLSPNVVVCEIAAPPLDE